MHNNCPRYRESSAVIEVFRRETCDFFMKTRYPSAGLPVLFYEQQDSVRYISSENTISSQHPKLLSPLHKLPHLNIYNLLLYSKSLL